MKKVSENSIVHRHFVKVLFLQKVKQGFQILFFFFFPSESLLPACLPRFILTLCIFYFLFFISRPLSLLFLSTACSGIICNLYLIMFGIAIWHMQSQGRLLSTKQGNERYLTMHDYNQSERLNSGKKKKTIFLQQQLHNIKIGTC